MPPPAENQYESVVGPYLLGKTLGVGTTGRVKLGTHQVTGKKVAVKIVSRANEHLKTNSLQNIEREITIMKLVQHPHILSLHDVYENDTELYLIMDLAPDGELFDYLVSKGRLSLRESLRFFRQLMEAMAFCHGNSVCHRDLKPENLLLDKEHGLRIADFGMAGLQASGKLLQTSCGSPHYAAPEVIRGRSYDGRKSDLWSCGVILYALLAGTLPFDAPQVYQVLNKVKEGKYRRIVHVPDTVNALVSGLLTVDPSKRYSMEDVQQNAWYRDGDDGTDGENARKLGMGQPRRNLPLERVFGDVSVAKPNLSVDLDVLYSMHSLNCFDKDALLKALLGPGMCTEKVVYVLLLQRKEQLESAADEWSLSLGSTESVASSASSTTPRRRFGSQHSVYLDGDESPLSSPLNRSMSPLSSPRNSSPLVHNNSAPEGTMGNHVAGSGGIGGADGAGITKASSGGRPAHNRARSVSDAHHPTQGHTRFLSPGANRRKRATSDPRVIKQVLISQTHARANGAGGASSGSNNGHTLPARPRPQPDDDMNGSQSESVRSSAEPASTPPAEQGSPGTERPSAARWSSNPDVFRAPLDARVDDGGGGGGDETVAALNLANRRLSGGAGAPRPLNVQTARDSSAVVISSPRFHRKKRIEMDMSLDDPEGGDPAGGGAVVAKRSWFASLRKQTPRPASSLGSGGGCGGDIGPATAVNLTRECSFNECCAFICQALATHDIKHQSSRAGAYKCKADGESYVDAESGRALKFRIDVVRREEQPGFMGLSLIKQQGSTAAFKRVVRLISPAT